MRSFARRVLEDLAPLAESHPGLTAALVRLADEIGLKLDLEVDPAFQVLFPPDPESVDSDDYWVAQRNAVRELAERWKARPPVELAQDLDLIAEEARRWGHPWPGQIPEFCGALVEKVASPEEYLKVFLDRASDPMLVSYFLRRAVDERRVGWESLLERSLRDPTYAWAAVDLVLNLQEPGDQLLDRALELAKPQEVEITCHRGAIPVQTLKRLLAHPKREIALAAAIGEWLADPAGEVRAEARPLWRGVVLGACSDEVMKSTIGSHRYWLQRILGKDPALAFEWIRAQLSASGGERPRFVSRHGLFPAAIAALDDEQRIARLDSLTGDRLAGRLLPYLIDGSPALYRRLLDRAELRQYHLAPMAGKVPDSAWIEMAGLAVEVGHDRRPPAARGATVLT